MWGGKATTVYVLLELFDEFVSVDVGRSIDRGERLRIEFVRYSFYWGNMVLSYLRSHRYLVVLSKYVNIHFLMYLDIDNLLK